MPLSLPVVALVSAALLVDGGCAAPAPASADSVEATMTSAQQPISRLVSQQTSGYQESVELVLRDQTALAGAWKTIFRGIPGNDPPAVDFAKDMVVVLALGARQTGGYAIRVDRVARDGRGAVVHYTVTSPGRDCMTAQMQTSPVEVVRVSRVDGAIRFVRTEVEDPC
jgi:hypothetical protein